MRISDWSSDVCSSDLTYRQIFDFGGPIPLVPLGDSVSPNSQTGLPGTFRDKLNENSTSWMLGVNYKATPTLLLYANVSKGYKAGSFPGVSAGTFAQYAAVTQESLVDYEAGFKTTLFDRKVRSEEHTSELQSLMRTSYAVFCLKKKTTKYK